MVDWFSPRQDREVRATRGDRRPTVTELSSELLIGEYPRAEDIGWLRDIFAVTSILNLQDDEDLRHNGIDLRDIETACQASAIKLVRIPICDGGAEYVAERLAPALDRLHALIDAGARVYLHCNAGMNRAPTIAIAFLHAHRNMSLEQALAHVKQRRPCGPFMTVLEDHFGARDLRRAR